MPVYHEDIDHLNVSKAELVVIVPPRDLAVTPKKTLTFLNHGDLPLADLKIETGPQAGVWIAKDLSGTGLPTLAAGAKGVFRLDEADRYVQVRAQGGAGTGASHIETWIDAIGP
jgi:hypothetical protein